MRISYSLVIAMLCTLCLTAKADSGGTTCLDKSQLSDYSVIDDSHLLYDTDFDGKYLMTVGPGCELMNADMIGVKTLSDSFLCTFDDVLTFEQGIGNTGECTIQSISKQ